MAKSKKIQKKEIKTAPEEVFYVGVNDAINVRRAILESSRELVQSLQQYDRFTAVRREKKELTMQLKDIVNDCSRELGKLKKKLPSLKNFSTIKPKVEKAKIPEKKEVKEIKAPKISEKEAQPEKRLGKHEMSELARLEKELNEIEARLGEM